MALFATNPIQMIHIFVGTKAQLIKMAPIMHELDRRDVAYNFIDAGQHAATTKDLIVQFKLRHADVSLRQKRTNITTIPQAIRWALQTLGRLTFRKNEVWKQVFRGEPGICLIHGDTLTTLISLLYAKRCGLQVAHVEAGLRSYHLLDPFPEEMIRLIAMRYSDLLFAPSDWAMSNLQSMGYADKAVTAGGNTVVDAVNYAQRHVNGHSRPSENYVVVTIHRLETIYSRSRMQMVANLLGRIAKERKIVFVLHEPTRRQLMHFDLYDILSKNANIKILPLQPYLTFIKLLSEADFIVTDGGSIQEESYFLNVPCLIMRSKTERIEGLGKNAFLGDFNQRSFDQFFDALSALRSSQDVEDVYPSSVIVDHVVGWADSVNARQSL